MHITCCISFQFTKYDCTKNTWKVRDGTLTAVILAMTWACQAADVRRKPAEVLSQPLLAGNGCSCFS